MSFSEYVRYESATVRLVRTGTGTDADAVRLLSAGLFSALFVAMSDWGPSPDHVASRGPLKARCGRLSGPKASATNEDC